MPGSTSWTREAFVQAESQSTAQPEKVLAVVIRTESDIVSARQAGRSLAATIGFNPTDQALIATAISELARNILRYAGSGEVRLIELSSARGGFGIEVVAADHGPGIANLDDAMLDGFTTSGGLGLGLPGAKRLMDDFHVETGPSGTTITALKFINSNA
jgi:serine/threonine-protein kinase RsbT